MGAKPAIAVSALPSIKPDTGLFCNPSACMLAIDFAALAIIYWLVVIGRYLVDPGYALSFYLELFPAVGLFLGAFFIQGLYPGLLLHPAEEMRRIFQCITIVFLLICSSTFLWRNADSYSRSVFLITWLCGAPAVLVARRLGRYLLARKSLWGVSAIILGSGPAAERVARRMNRNGSGIRLKGILTEQQPLAWAEDLPPVLGGFSEAPGIAASRSALYAILAMPQGPNHEVKRIIQDFCTGFRHVLLIHDLNGLCSLGVIAREIGGEIGLEVPQRLFHKSSALGKQIMDLSLSSFGLLLFSPIFVVVSVLTKLTSKGPIFYGHARYGLRSNMFKALKFRTMVQNGDDVLLEYLRSRPDAFGVWQREHKLKQDPRVTRIGKWLRRFSLDELPQLLNVLKGEMSLVGPRPIVKAEIDRYGHGYDLYTRVRPGITGLWQVSGRNNTTYEERVAFDEYYVRNWSVWLDLYILVKTIKAVITANGAY